MSAGFVMLLLSCAAAYVYLFYLKPKAEQEEAAGSPGGFRTVAKRPLSASHTPNTDSQNILEGAQPGDFMQLQDVGPQMLELSVQISHCHRAKIGMTRKIVLEGETGTGPCWMTTYPQSPHQIWASIQIIPPESIPISKAHLQSLTPDTDYRVDWEGVTYTFNGKEVRQFCPDGNELESEEQTGWRFQNRDAVLEVLRSANGAYMAAIYAAVHRQQVSLLKGA